MVRSWVIADRWKFEVRDLHTGIIQVSLNDSTYFMTKEEFDLFCSVIEDYKAQLPKNKFDNEGIS